MNPAKTTVPIPGASRLLTAADFQQLTDVPPEVEWFRNLDNPHTGRAYQNAIRDFMEFTGIRKPEQFRLVTRAHVIAWRDDLRRRVGKNGRKLGQDTIRHRLSALSALYNYLCDRNAVTHNPCKGVRRPKAETNEGKTPAISDRQARKLLAAPGEDNLKGRGKTMKRREMLLSMMAAAAAMTLAAPANEGASREMRSFAEVRSPGWKSMWSLPAAISHLARSSLVT